MFDEEYASNSRLKLELISQMTNLDAEAPEVTDSDVCKAIKP